MSRGKWNSCNCDRWLKNGWFPKHLAPRVCPKSLFLNENNNNDDEQAHTTLPVQNAGSVKLTERMFQVLVRQLEKLAASVLSPTSAGGSLGGAGLPIQRRLGPSPASPAYQPHVLCASSPCRMEMTLSPGQNSREQQRACVQRLAQ